jgi:hypothetical protein
LHLIAGIKALSLNQTGGQTESHRRIIGPFSWPKSKGATPNHLLKGGKGAGLAELERGAKGIANG